MSCNLPFCIYSAAIQFPEQLAVIENYYHYTYRNYAEMVATAKLFLGSYVQRGEHIAILLPPGIHYCVCLLALWSLGAIAVPMNSYFPLQQITQLAKEIACSKIIIENQSIDYSPLHSLAITDILSQPTSDIAIIDQQIPDTQPVTIIFTSGSSGSPKAAVHTYANHYYSALGSNEYIPLAPGDCWLHSLPLFHVGGLAIIMRTMLSRATTVFSQQKDLPLLLQTQNITHVSLVTTQLQRLLAAGDTHFVNLKAVLLGGSAIPLPLVEQSVRRGWPVFCSYGSTEMSSQIATTEVKTLHNLSDMTAKVLPYRELKISPEGEILVKGNTLFAGYLCDHKLQLAVDSQGWFATGDLGECDSKGYLRVFGRKDNMFISGGENIHPQEIEQCLQNIIGIRQAMVVPIENKEFGYRPVAFVDAENWQEKLWKAVLREKIAKYKVPDYFLPWPSSPPTKGIKLDRQKFIELAKTDVIFE